MVATSEEDPPAPIATALTRSHKDIEYIEVVSSIASKSAGPATRRNLDEYIETTEDGIKKFSGVKKAKAILNLNPAFPCINMQTTIKNVLVLPGFIFIIRLNFLPYNKTL